MHMKEIWWEPVVNAKFHRGKDFTAVPGVTDGLATRQGKKGMVLLDGRPLWAKTCREFKETLIDSDIQLEACMEGLISY